MATLIENRDARTLHPQAQEELRRRAIKMLNQGRTQQAVANDLDVTRQAVGKWWKRYRDGGWSSVKKQKRGRRKGDNRFLSPEQESEIQKLICDKTPDQLKLKYALWSRDAVRQLIKDRYGIEYALQSLSIILKRWGFTPQRPLKKAYEQRPAEVKKWLKETYPLVEEKAKAEKAEIWWGDETAIKPECHYRRGYSPKGKTPVVRQPAKRFHSSLISAINNQGKMQWMPLQDSLNADIFIKFLKQLIKFRKRKIILVVDNLRVHHSKIVQEWLADRTDQIELVFLPSYSPELNPDEYMNNYLKQTVTKEGPPTDKDNLDDDVWFHMTCLRNLADLVASFFRHPAVTYAA
jgi:transposase